MHQNEIAAIILAALCLLGGERRALPAVILSYYLLYFLAFNSPAIIFKLSDLSEIIAIYMVQALIDAVIMFLIYALSFFYQKNIKLLFAYALCVASSLALNCVMMFDQLADWYMPIFSELHHYRQIIAVPLDLLFAVLWSAKSGKTRIVDDNLLNVRRESYNRLHCFKPSLQDKESH